MRDTSTILAMKAQAGGFALRRMARRNDVALGEGTYRQSLEQFFGRLDDYRLEPEDLQTSIIGEVGLAWGVYLEQFQERGRVPERAWVRFSKILTKGARGWQGLFYHPDIQPFIEDGRYPKALTVVGWEQIHAHAELHVSARLPAPRIGRFPATGKSTTCTGSSVFQIAEGKVAEEMGEEDALSVRQ